MWVLPEELRRIAGRAPGLTDPDRMGQAIMRAPKPENLPDPLRIYLRDMVALAGGRMALIPAVAIFERVRFGKRPREIQPGPGGFARSQVRGAPWRPGPGPTPSTALGAALRTMLPVDTE